MRILLVDDEATILSTYTRLFRRNGFAVVVPVVKAPAKKRVLKKGLTASIRQAAASILRRQAVVVRRPGRGQQPR